jgi:hypothetical protein
MDIVKKNLISILCGVVAVVAIILLFWPTHGYQDKLQADLTARKEVYNSLTQLQGRQRNLPIVTPGQSEPAPLGRFPSEPVIAAGNQAKQKVQTQAQQMLKDAIALNTHSLLVADSLPAPRTTDQFRFTQEYVKRLNLRQDPNNSECLQTAILHGVQPPTQDEVKQAAADLWENKFKPQVAHYGNNQSNEADVKADFDRAAAALPEQLMQQAATGHKIYVERDAFDFDPTVQKAAVEGQPASPVDIWYAQMGLWIESDVAKAIAQANEQSQNVLSSPVKRLVKITLPRADQGFYVMPGAPAGGGNPGNQPVAVQSVGPETVVAGVSPTGRVSKTRSVVVEVDLVADVEASMVPVFLENLTRNQFIYVNQLSLASVDSMAMKAQGYLYGDKPVVRLTLKCEILFLRGWTVRLMPAEVKQRLGVAPQQTAGL